MLNLLEKTAKISSSKDRLDITTKFLEGFFEYTDAIDICLYQISNSVLLSLAYINHLGVCISALDDVNNTPQISKKLHDLALQGENVKFFNHQSTMPSYVFSNSKSSKQSEQLVVLLNVKWDLTIEAQTALNYFFLYFINYISLLDYSECDSLTGLLNRKTFDDTFYNILNARIIDLPTSATNNKRRGESVESENDYWLAELDIDKFKNINDNFGHLFGDEVLIRVSNIMRKYLRSYDKLFRFGGEEFIIIFKTTNRQSAWLVLNRLIDLIENSEFPQVGKVTCSIGFTRIDSVIPVDILGKADQALYYAKNNGRNQVQCYEALIEQGLLKESSISSNAQDDVDIFFD